MKKKEIKLNELEFLWTMFWLLGIFSFIGIVGGLVEEVYKRYLSSE